MSENAPSRTELSDLGEFGLIEHLTSNLTHQRESTVYGVGDDAAILDNGSDQYSLLSTDMLVEGVHFDLSYVPLQHLGYKAVIVNISDICAMNGIAEQVTVSIAVSNRFSVEALEELYKGIRLACERYKVDLVGGDTTSSSSGLVISVTAHGRVDKDKVARRDTAKEKDLLVVTGDLGGAYMGLQILEREKSVFQEAPSVQPDLQGHDYILERQLKPEARVDIVKYLADAGVVPSAMIDISDGLASEIFHIGTRSKLGCHLYEAKIPMDKSMYDTAREFELDPTLCVLSGGEDYELLMTLSVEDYEKIKDVTNFEAIGYMTDQASGFNMETKDGHVVPIKAQGWKHLSD
ncbi:MAG: thiamine-phosphate kinase [Flavobacteriales bacterium]|nr:thiamine-phosphate kinase [Flavobacteriales bacterium]